MWGRDQHFSPPYKYPISWAPLIEKTVHFPPFCHTTFARNEACMRPFVFSVLFYCTFAHLVPTQKCLIWCWIIYLICVVYVLQICYSSLRLSFLFLCSTFSYKFLIQLINLQNKRHADILIRMSLNFISFWRGLIFFTVFCIQYWFFQSINMLYLLSHLSLL